MASGVDSGPPRTRVTLSGPNVAFDGIVVAGREAARALAALSAVAFFSSDASFTSMQEARSVAPTRAIAVERSRERAG
jgi:hypothetical protein